MTFEEPYNGCPDCHEYERERLQQQAEIERLRKFASRIWLAEDSPAWAHDAAAKVLGEPSLAHGASEAGDDRPASQAAG